jgi:multicomponent Na+:H+ antiporter subunit E
MSYVIHFVMSFLLWVLLVWPFRVGVLTLLCMPLHWAMPGSSPATGPVLEPGAAQSLICGLLVATLVAGVFGRMFPRNPGRLLNPARYLWLAAYVPTFLWACLMANLDVAYRVLHLRLPIRPGIVKVRTTIRSDMGKFILANSITLTPGTLSVDFVGQDLYIHWINVSGDSPQARAQIILGQFEGILKKVFD